MLVGTLNRIREEKASRMRDVQYIREMVLEDAIDDRFFELEIKTVKESGNIYSESVKMIEQIPATDEHRKEEINRILNSDRALSFDEMIGISDDE